MRHSHFTVVYDACVLYPAPLRDLLMRLAVTGAFRARWTEKIHDEWVRNLLLSRPRSGPGEAGTNSETDERRRARLLYVVKELSI